MHSEGLSERERAAILAALRLWQRSFCREEKPRGRVEDYSATIVDIATNGGAWASLSFAEIEKLCERLVTGEVRP